MMMMGERERKYCGFMSSEKQARATTSNLFNMVDWIIISTINKNI
jgi:hypothetical protein